MDADQHQVTKKEKKLEKKEKKARKQEKKQRKEEKWAREEREQKKKAEKSDGVKMSEFTIVPANSPAVSVRMTRQNMAELNLPGRDVFGPLTEKEKSMAADTLWCLNRTAREMCQADLSQRIQATRTAVLEDKLGVGPTPLKQIIRDYSSELDHFKGIQALRAKETPIKPKEIPIVAPAATLTAIERETLIRRCDTQISLCVSLGEMAIYAPQMLEPIIKIGCKIKMLRRGLKQGTITGRAAEISRSIDDYQDAFMAHSDTIFKAIDDNKERQKKELGL